MPKLLKKFLPLVLIVFVIAALIFGQLKNELNRRRELEVIFFNVGQGDSALVRTPNDKTILIDGGPDNTVIYKLGQYLPIWRREIDLVVLSHPHSDHLVGLIEVLKRYRVKSILTTGVIHPTPDYQKWLEIINDTKVPVIYAPTSSLAGVDSGLQTEIFYPKDSLLGRQIENLNNGSMVIKLKYGNISFLFPGDLEAKAQAEIMNDDIKSTVIKVPHQGSSDSLNLDFLKKVEPKIAVIPVGENSYGHPSPRTIKTLERLGAIVYTTQKDGDIKITTDGITFKTQYGVD